MTTFLNVTDRATTTLHTTINASDTTIVLNTGDGVLFPSTNFIITIENERILIDSRSTDTLTVNVSGRAYAGSTAASHTAGVAVQLRVTATSITEMQSAINARQLTANLDTTTTLGTSDTLYPSQKAVKTYVDNNIPNKLYIASDNLISSADTERTQTSGTYTKTKEIQFSGSGTLRIKFDLHADGSNQGRGQIWVNGVAAGTDQVTSSATYVTFSQDLVNIPSGALIQLYIKITGSLATIYTRNFRVYGDYGTVLANVNLN